MIKLSKDEILRLKPLVGKNQGCYGKCYEYGSNVIKVLLNNKKVKDERNRIIGRINDLLETKVSDVAFPIDIRKEKDFFAILEPYISGVSYANLTDEIEKETIDISLEQLSINYHNGLNKVLEIAENDVHIIDLKTDNCKFKLETLEIGIFDVDFYKKVKNPDYEKLFINNVMCLNETFRTFLNYYFKFLDLNIYDIVLDKKNLSYTYVDDALEIIVKNTSSKIKTLGEIIRK